MPSRFWFERPWLAALVTLVVTLVPVALAVRHLQRAAQASDAAIFAATSSTVEQKLRLATVRHLSWLTIFRNRLGSVRPHTAEAVDRELPPHIWRNGPPHWSVLAFTDGETLLWARGREDGAVRAGDKITAQPALAALLARIASASPADRQLPWSIPWPGQQLCVAFALSGESHGFVLGWLDLAGLCRDPQAQMAPGALHTTAASAAAPGEHHLATIGEGRLMWTAAIARGPRYAELLAHPPARYLLAAGALTALLFAALAGFVAQTRLAVQRTDALRTALAAERELGRLRSHFVSTVSHEFRTPLSVILSSADLLAGYGGQLTPERHGELLAQIQDATRHMTQMVEEVLLLGRIESSRLQPRPAPLDVAAFGHDLAREVSTATRGRNPVSVLVPTNLGLVMLDAGLLRSVLTNLLTNAVKYSPAGRPVEFALLRAGAELRFRVRDEGIGIPAADLARMGEPFHRGANVGDAPGTGLGLAIVKRCVALLGGTFALESQPARGTTATVALPFPPAA